MAKNEAEWLEMAEAKALNCHASDRVDKLWEWLQKMEDDGKIRSIDLMRIKSALDLAFEIGQESIDGF